ncbi:MAG TPA: PH domain-containing protein [Candidatus Paceibacterota bacterium]
MKQLDPKAVWFFFINSILRAIIPAIIVASWVLELLSGSVENGETSLKVFNWLWLIVPVFFALCYGWAKLTYRFYRYELLDSGFRKESGVIYKKYVTIPYDRIQNVDINRGILARILGLSDLNIQTAGMGAATIGGGAEGRLPAVSKEDGEKLRDELIQRTRQSKNQGL